MIYLVSDLHGYPLERFTEMLADTGFSDDDTLYVLGDVIDRGEDGTALLRWIMSKPNVQMILGNHEIMMMDCGFLFDEITDASLSSLSDDDIEAFSHWMSNGGQPTLKALKELSPDERADILDFLSDLPYYGAETVNGRDYLFTHSGLGNFRRDKKLSGYTVHDLTWTRPTLGTRYFEDITVIFGHTPTVAYGPEYAGKAVVTETWINIDAGAAGGYVPMILRLDDMKQFYFGEEKR